MKNNRTFFKRVKSEGAMRLGDIFSEVTAKHTKEDAARVFVAGTELTTPKKSEMLAGWQKPFLFARFFGLCTLFLLLCYALGKIFDHSSGYFLLMTGIPLLVPMTVLILSWEMNIPRDISLLEVIKIVAVGGALSLIATLVLSKLGIDVSVTWAGLIEEPAKLVVIFCLLKRKNRVYILDGVLIGMAVGTGFAVMETIFYVFRAFTDSVVISMLSLIDALQQAGCSQVSDLLAVLSEQYSAVYYMTSGDGFSNGLAVALLRAFNGICGHGMYAALYGGGLLMAKGSEEIRFSHLFKLNHLKYFAAAVLLHALNNSGFTFGLPSFFNGMIHGVLILNTILGIAIFLPLLRTGVNQIVTVCAEENGGRVTMAVNRNASNPIVPAASPAVKLVCMAGPDIGRRYRCEEGQPAILGRDPQRCNIVISGNSSVSSVHCKVEILGGKVTVTDLGSTNGTYVETANGKRLDAYQPTPVYNGTNICLGDNTSVFRVEIG